MANIKIAQLTNQINIADTDLMLIESATSTNKMTVGKFKELIGAPLGGVVESGQDANGSYTKYADGTLECSAFVKFVYLTGGAIIATFSMPKNFTKITGVSAVLSEVNPSGTADFPLVGTIGSPMLISSTSINSVVLKFYGSGFVPGDYVWASIIVRGRSDN